MGKASSDVRVLAVSRLAPSPPAAAKGDQLLQEKVVKLSFFDTPWVVLPPIQRVFLYDLGAADGGDGDGGDGGDRFPALVERLKGALVDTLALYLPLAGRLEYVAETGDVVVDCSSDAGVAFVEADATGGSMDVHRLAADEAHDVPAFASSIPRDTEGASEETVEGCTSYRLRACTMG